MNGLSVLIVLLLVVVNTGKPDREWSSRAQNGEKLLFQGEITAKPVTGKLCDKTKQLSGYFKIDGSKTKNYFYWFFESRNDPANDPTIIWLTGGPGCSSMLALLMENGPCSVQPNLTLASNPYSWNSKANIMWIDQPAGVGFSYGDTKEYDTNEKMVGDDMFHFLQSFFHKFPQYQKQDFYVFGESYGGHYVPAVAHRIYMGNKQKEGVHINLKGLGIGNGLVSPEDQYPMYPEMAFHNTYNIKAISQNIYSAMKKASPKCVAMIKVCQKFKAACLVAQIYCNEVLVAPYQLSGLNVYDIREKCKHWPMCYDFSLIEKFLRLPSTLKALNVSPKSAKWKSCNMVVHTGFTFDWMKNFDNLIPDMVEDGIRVLVYAGDADFIVNWIGCKAWTLTLNWKHQDAFVKTKDSDWLVGKKKAGQIRTSNGLTFLRVFEAGHMVPMNQPKNSLQMLEEFTSKKGFSKVNDPQETTFDENIEPYGDEVISDDQSVM